MREEQANMPNYKGMYTVAFQAQTKAIEVLEGVVDALKTAQLTTEGMYMDAEAPILDLLEAKKQENEDGEPSEPE
jgi:hypothetical protein